MTIAHRSGGPESDIIVPLQDGQEPGYLAETPEEYASIMSRVFDEQESSTFRGGRIADRRGSLNRDDDGVFDQLLRTFSVRVAARVSAKRFSNEEFDDVFAAEFSKLLPLSGPRWWQVARRFKYKAG